MKELPDDVAIFAKGLTKIYPGDSASASFVSVARRLLGRSPTGAKAIEGIDLEVRAGHALGIVGRNGSGKSTLLKTLAGALSPTAGEFWMRGRVGTLLDLGVGIHPEYSGTENALVLGMLAGLSRSEARSKLPEIHAFSGLGDAFERPAKTYSSGMTLRLAFSAAIHCDPEILLIDEALAVGDAFYQQRCLARLRKLREEGTTIVLVSHDPSAVISLCDEAIWLDHGQISAAGRPADVVQRYLAARYSDQFALDAPLEAVSDLQDRSSGAAELDVLVPATSLSDHDERYGDGRARVVGFEVRDAADEATRRISPGERMRVILRIQARSRVEFPLVGFTIRNRLGDIVTATNTELAGTPLRALAAGDEIDVALDFLWPSLSPGPFSFSPAIADGSIASHLMADWVENAWIVEAENARGLFGWLTLDAVQVRQGAPRRQGVRRAEGTDSPAGREGAALHEVQSEGLLSVHPKDRVPIEFALEKPLRSKIEPDELTEDGMLFVSGWCFAANSEQVEIEGQIGDAAARTVVPGKYRPDVAMPHSGVESAARSGFGILLPLPDRPGKNRLRLAISNRGVVQRVEEVAIEIPARLEIVESTPARPQERMCSAGPESRRVVFVSHSLNLEGAPRSLFETATALHDDRFPKRSDCIWSAQDGPLREAWQASGMTPEIIPPDPGWACKDSFDANVRRLAGRASIWHPSLLVANTLETFWAVHVAAELGRPSIWIVRESENPDSYFHSRWPTAIAEKALQSFEMADRVVFVAEATRALFASRIDEEKTRLIPNGLDLSRFDTTQQAVAKTAISRELKIAEDLPLILCVGTTCARKGQLELLNALAALSESRPRFHCVFLGVVEGDYLSSMRDRIQALGLSKRVTLASPVLDARPYFAAADVVACPSFQESLPRVVLEAMALARPVVATNVFGNPELVRDEVDGLLVPPGDIESLAKSIDRVLADTSLAERFGKSARERVEQHFSLDRCAQRYSDLIAELLGNEDRLASP